MSEPSETEPGADDLVGSVLAGRYRIVSLLGAGGMGAVYRAEHVHMRKAVAVKVLHREMTSMPEVVARFEREAVAAARIEHPNVAAATDFGSLENGSFYLALEFIEGDSLAQRIKKDGAFEEGRALRIARQIAEALSAAHAAGIVHRDLKPDNVMLVERESTSEFVKVLDFGIAKVQLEATSDQPLTQMGVVFGTPEYMSPEQARGLEVDARTDLYALGLILYEMVSGVSPFRHEDLVAVLTRQITMEPPPLPESLSDGIKELVAKLLRKDPAERLQTATSVRDQIDVLLHNAGPASSVGAAPNSGTPTGTVLPATRSRVQVDGRTALALPALAREPYRVLLAWSARLGLERRLRVGPYAVPLGAVLGLALLLFVALGLAAALVAVSHGGPPEAAALPPRPQDPDVLTLVSQAENGDANALTALLARPERKRSLIEWRALGHGFCLQEDAKQCLAIYAAGIAQHREIGSDQRVLSDIRRLAERLDVGEDAMQLAAQSLGPAGADLLFDVWEKGKTSAAGASNRARALLDEEPAKAHVSSALRALLLLQAAMKKPKCSELKQLMPDIARDVDERSLSTLARLSDRRGCGFLGLSDCYACLRSGSELGKALDAAKSHPRPNFNAPSETIVLPKAQH